MRSIDGTQIIPQVSSTYEHSFGQFDALFSRISFEFEPAHISSGDAIALSVEAAHALDFGGEVVLDWRGEFGRALVLELASGAFAHVHMQKYLSRVWVVSDDPELAASERKRTVDQIGQLLDDDEKRLPVSFWSRQPQQVESIHRKLEVSDWDSVRDNYAQSTSAAIERLACGFEPTKSGLILWTGEPGTGKSRAVEALADSWRDWCEINFITDPEEFLWHGSWYMMHVATKTRSRPARTGREDYSKWQLIVLEDSGELLTVDASTQTGQGMARLLNLTDGALGHGLQTIVLVTTNEPLNKIHPAVSRPGRCIQLHEFERLSIPEANAWLDSQGLKTSVAAPATLAELYAIRNGDSTLGTKASQVGFAA
ncbi:MAG: AAA family ATPase [Solirubrobacterales bacterium]|nr:AAA family ATPase [Solirubrobacterales bacterium]